jgi:hypothetical protein
MVADFVLRLMLKFLPGMKDLETLHHIGLALNYV